MQPSLARPITIAALAAAAAICPGAASAAQIHYQLQGVTDSSPVPVALVGGFTFDTVSSTFSDVTVQFASTPVQGTATGIFDQTPTLYHYATDQFVAWDLAGNAVVLNYGSTFDNPGTYALTQTGPNSMSYVLLSALAGTDAAYDVVNGNLVAVPEPGAWVLLSAGVLVLGSLSRRRRGA